MARATLPAQVERLLNRVWPDHAVEKSGQEHMVECPFCASDKAKCAVNTDKGVFQCWVCSERGPVSKLLSHLVTLKVISKSDIDAVVVGGKKAKLSSSIQQLNPTKEKTTEVQYWSKYIPCVFPTHVYPLSSYTPKSFIEKKVMETTISYLASRGVDMAAIRRYRLHFCTNLSGSVYNAHIFFPALGPHGRQLVFWTTRAISNAITPKSLHASSKYSRFSAKHILFNEHLIADTTVALCEGPFDALSIMKETGITACPLLGKVLHTYHVDALREKGVNTVYLCLDPDAKAQTAKMGRALSHAMQVRYVLLENGDPNDIPPDELRAAFGKATLDLDDELSTITSTIGF